MRTCSFPKGGILSSAIVILVLIVDQFIKISVKTNMYLREDIQVFDWFHLFFTENKGMAFGMDFFGTLFLSIFRLVFSFFIIFYIRHTLRQHPPKAFIACISLVLAGAFGNIIDNTFYGLFFSESTPYQIASFVPWGEGYSQILSGRVVDMFYFPLFEFYWPLWVPVIGGQHFLFFSAIFNFADAAISCGGIAILLFYPKYLSQSLGLFLQHEKRQS